MLLRGGARTTRWSQAECAFEVRLLAHSLSAKTGPLNESGLRKEGARRVHNTGRGFG